MSQDYNGFYKVVIKIPYSNKRVAQLVYDVLSVDPEPKRSFITKKFDLIDNLLCVEFTGELAKNVRVGVSSFFESLLLCCETIREFGQPTEEYKYN